LSVDKSEETTLTLNMAKVCITFLVFTLTASEDSAQNAGVETSRCGQNIAGQDVKFDESIDT
jgi:hypothetical protein